MARRHGSNPSNNTSLNSSQIETTTSRIARISFKKYYGIFLKTVCLAFVLFCIFYVYSCFEKLQAENDNFLNENKALKSEIKILSEDFKILNEHLEALNGNLKTLESDIQDYQIKDAKLTVFYGNCLDNEKIVQKKLNELTYIHENFKNMSKIELEELKKKMYDFQLKEEGCDAFSFLNRTYFKIKAKFDKYF